MLWDLQEEEEKEKTDASTEPPAKQGKLGKLGKLKPKKAKIETEPSPMGRRIQPRIDSAMKVKAEKDAARKIKAKVSIWYGGPQPRVASVWSGSEKVCTSTLAEVSVNDVNRN